MPKGGPSSKGSFREDLLQLLEQVNDQLLIELGKPLPADKHLPAHHPARCPANHNRKLLDNREP